MKVMIVRLGLAIATISAFSPLAHAADCKLYEGENLTGKEYDLTDGGGVDDLVDAWSPLKGVKSVWIRSGYALQTFQGTYYSGLTWTGLFDTRDGETYKVKRSNDGNFYANLAGTDEATAQSMRCHISGVVLPVKLGGDDATGYRVDFYNDRVFSYGNGGPEWNLDVKLKVAVINGQKLLDIQHNEIFYTRTNGGPGVPPKYLNRHFALDLDTAAITLTNPSLDLSGTVTLRPGKDLEAALAYDSALGQMVAILDRYVGVTPEKAELRDLRDLLKQRLFTPSM